MTSDLYGNSLDDVALSGKVPLPILLKLSPRLREITRRSEVSPPHSLPSLSHRHFLIAFRPIVCNVKGGL